MLALYIVLASRWNLIILFRWDLAEVSDGDVHIAVKRIRTLIQKLDLIFTITKKRKYTAVMLIIFMYTCKFS
jgi:hypothetical protein